MPDLSLGEGPPPAPKADPQSLVLRGRPRPVVRFRRGLIVGVAGAVAASLIALAWVALEPPGLRLASGEEEAGQPLRKSSAEALADAPASYGDVPRLGPPLPGDLGRPILDHQRSLESAEPVDAASASVAAQAEAERQRSAEAEQAARSSGLVVPLTSANASGANPAPGDIRHPSRLETDAAAEPKEASSAGERHQAELASRTGGEVNPYPLREAPSPWTLSAGTIIPASLVTGLNSDLPGIVIAQVTENVFDSATGRTILVPRGARLIGRYDSAVNYGQRRALLAWQRIVFPDGSSIQLDNMPASDAAGRAGLADRVDGHSWQLVKGALLSSLVGVGTQLSFGGDRGLVRALRESLQQNASRTGEQAAAKGLSVQPTIKVRPGWPVRVLVGEDLVLQPWTK